jgi:hypothetical protein
MSNYTVTTNFGAKDSLASGNPLKLIVGAQLTTEYNNIATAITSKYDSSTTSITLTSLIAASAIIGAPASGTALTANAISGQFAAVFNGAGSAGSQKGLSVATGTQNAADVIINLNNSSSNLMILFGDGHGVLGYNGAANTISWSAAGSVAIATPATATIALTVAGVANSRTASFLAASTSGQSFGPIIQAGTTTGDTALDIFNASGGTEYLRVFGDGGLCLGTAIAGTGSEGPGTLNATGVFINGVAIVQAGSFTGTLNNGFTSNPTGTVNYQRVGKIVTLTCIAGITGTSNGTSMGMTGLPAAVTPATGSPQVTCVVLDGGGSTLGSAQVGSGTITFFSNRNGTALVGAQFSNIGTKGISGGWTITYTLD